MDDRQAEELRRIAEDDRYEAMARDGKFVPGGPIGKPKLLLAPDDEIWMTPRMAEIYLAQLFRRIKRD